MIFSSEYFRLNLIRYKFPFLYANSQIVDLNEGKEIYELKFKVGSYYDKNVFIIDKNNAFPLL